MRTIIGELSSFGDPAAVLLGASYLDNALEVLLTAQFVDLGKLDKERMFSATSNGILGSFAAKIRVAYALDLIGPKTYQDLLIILDVRNNFAHSLRPLTFANKWIQERCDDLSLVAEAFLVKTAEARTHALELFVETVYVVYVFIRANAMTIVHNKTVTEPKDYLPLKKDVF